MKCAAVWWIFEKGGRFQLCVVGLIELSASLAGPRAEQAAAASATVNLPWSCSRGRLIRLSAITLPFWPPLAVCWHSWMLIARIDTSNLFSSTTDYISSNGCHWLATSHVTQVPPVGPERFHFKLIAMNAINWVRTIQRKLIRRQKCGH